MADLPRIFASARTRWTTIAILVVLTALFVGGSAIAGRVVPELTDSAEIHAIVRSYGVLAPLAFVALQAIQIVLAPVPGQAMGFIAGYLFGAALGTFYTVVGAGIGTFVALALARQFGRPYVERAIDPDVLAGFDELAGRRGLLALFLVYLIPGLPDDVLCFVGGLTELDIRDMLVVSILGRLPSYVVVNLAGANLAESQFLETTILLGIVVGIAFVVYLRRDAVIRGILSSTGHRD